MPTRLRKVRKQRGSRTYGWGQSAGHRGAGSHGGFGKTGAHKHRWTYIMSHDPNYFGKHGFYRPKMNDISVNVGELDQLSKDLLTSNQAVQNEDGIYIDLKALGVGKLLSSGRVTQPFILKVKAVSSKAASKIREAKGQIINA